VEAKMDAGVCLMGRNFQLMKSLSLLFGSLKKAFGDLADVSKNISTNAAESLHVEDIKKYSSVQAFGCSPSLVFKETDLTISKPSVDPLIVPWRSAGFHVHLGYRLNIDPVSAASTAMKKILTQTENLVRLVQMCDILAGIPGVILERNTEAVKLRRKVLGYGQAGEFREQPHGFEYRTLGPWPLTHPMWSWLANALVREAFILVMNNVDIDFLPKFNRAEVIETINNNDLVGAIKIWNTAKKALSELGNTIYLQNTSHPLFNPTSLQRVEFLMASGGLQTHSPVFAFSAWGITNHLEAHYQINQYNWATRAYNWGFDQHASNITLTNPNFAEFAKQWTGNNDSLSRYLLP
jgi:hypothetical protein